MPMIKRLLARSLFFRLMASFLLVITTVSSFYLVSYSLYFNNLKTELLNISKERLEITANKFDYDFANVMNVLYKLYSDERFRPMLGNKEVTYLEMKGLRDLMLRFVSLDEGINNIFLVSDNSNYIISSAGTFDREKFFTEFYYSPDYGNDFWTKERSEEFFYKIYDTSVYSYRSKPSEEPMKLLPLAFKQNRNSKFILIALVNMNKLVSDIDKSFLSNFTILGQSGKVIYTAGTAKNVFAELPESNIARKVKGGFVLARNAKRFELKYIRFLPDIELKGTLYKSTAVMLAILLVAVLLSVLLSYFISRYTNRQALKIVEIMGGSENAGLDDKTNTDFMNIRNKIKRILEQNSQFSNELKAKDLILEDSLYRARILDVHVQPSDMDNRLSIKDDYVLACFELRYMQSYCQALDDQSKDAYRLKELIELWLKEHFKNCIVFQSENRRIVSIINTHSGCSGLSPEAAISCVIEKIKEEKPFVYFTVAISSVMKDVLALDTAYDEMTNLLKYRKLAEINQILTERSEELKKSTFSFSLAQAEHFTNYLRNGRQNECIQQLNEILDSNIKNGITNFQMTLLCIEIINCGVRVLSDSNKILIQDMNIPDIYEKLNHCWLPEQYKSICENFVIALAGCVNTYEKNKEYIVDYIKGYVENHYSEDIYLDLLAEKLNLSKVYISLHFKNKTGVNFSDWLNDYRIKKATELLDNTAMKVQDIARKVGINADTFIRVFKRYYGKTPNEYRQIKLISKQH